MDELPNTVDKEKIAAIWAFYWFGQYLSCADPHFLFEINFKEMPLINAYLKDKPVHSDLQYVDFLAYMKSVLLK